MNNIGVAKTILRFGMAAVLLWFGFSQIFNGIDWVGMVPGWLSGVLRMPPAIIVILNGIFEIILGLLLATGLLIRPAAFLAGLHILLIAFSIGANAVGVRDFGLSTAAFALVFFPKQPLAD